jgi:hypothetical protein
MRGCNNAASISATSLSNSKPVKAGSKPSIASASPLQKVKFAGWWVNPAPEKPDRQSHLRRGERQLARDR